MTAAPSAAVIDGLGHGDAAADAAAVASGRIRRHRREPAESLLRRCHAALRKTRGAVITLAWFDLEAKTFSVGGRGERRGALRARRGGVRRPP